MLLDAILLAATSAVALVAVLLVALAHNVSGRVKASFIVMMLGLTLWQVNIYVADTLTSNLIFWNHLVFLWPTIATASFYVFVWLVRKYSPDAEVRVHPTRSKIADRIVYGATALQVAAIASGRIFSDVFYDFSSGTYTFVRGDAYPIYIVGLIFLLFTAFYTLIVGFAENRKRSQERRALKIVVLTVALAIAFGLATNVLLPLFLAGQDYISLGSMTIDILALGFALSIFRYQFLDIQIYIFRTITYLLTLLFFGFAYVFIVGVVVFDLFNFDIKPGVIAVSSLATLAVAASFEPLRGWFNRRTSSLFLRDYYDSQKILDNLAGILVGSVDRKAIIDKSVALLEATLKSNQVSIVMNIDDGNDIAAKDLIDSLSRVGSDVVDPYGLEDGNHLSVTKALKRNNVALAVKLRSEKEDIGFILLGFRRSGSGYSSADKKLLALIASQMALGLQNALRFEEIERFNKTLQEKIDEATKQLRRQNQRLKMLDQTKDDFISMASHQLRTPLTAVKGYISMVLEGDGGKITGLQRRLLNQSFMSAQRMVYLISDLLNVSRLRTGKFELDLVPCNLSKLIDGELTQLKEAAQARSVELTFDKPEHFPTYMLDETKLRQVVMNFMDNAIYYTPSGGTISVVLAERPESIEFTVTDTGIGVPRGDQPHMFTKYFRAHNAQVARPDGTGLGLFMAKKVIIAHGGAVIFKSRERKGSQFGFSLPKKALETPPQKQ